MGATWTSGSDDGHDARASGGLCVPGGAGCVCRLRCAARRRRRRRPAPRRRPPSPTAPAPSVDGPGRRHRARRRPAAEAAPTRRCPADMLIYSQEALSDDVVERIKALDGRGRGRAAGAGHRGGREPRDHGRLGRPGDVPPLHAGRGRPAAGHLGPGRRAARWRCRRSWAGGSRTSPATSSSATTRTRPRCTSAPTRRRCRSIDAVVNEKWGEELEVPHGQRDESDQDRHQSPPEVARTSHEDRRRRRGRHPILGPDLDPGALQTAMLDRRLGRAGGRLVPLPGARRRPDRPGQRVGDEPTSAPSRCRSWAASPATR